MWIKGKKKLLNLNAVTTIEYDEKKNRTIAKAGEYTFILSEGDKMERVLKAIKKYRYNDIIDKDDL